MLNINNLYSEFQKKQKGRFDTYQDVLLKCHRKIKLTASNLNTELYFKVPDYIFGKPLYDVNACREFIIQKLVYNGFFATHVGNSIIYISWQKHTHSNNQINNKNNNTNTSYNNNFLKSSSYFKDINNQLIDNDIKDLNFNVNINNNIQKNLYNTHSNSRNMPINNSIYDEPSQKKNKSSIFINKLKHKYKDLN